MGITDDHYANLGREHQAQIDADANDEQQEEMFKNEVLDDLVAGNSSTFGIDITDIYELIEQKYQQWKENKKCQPY
jgi:hypothetical protein